MNNLRAFPTRSVRPAEWPWPARLQFAVWVIGHSLFALGEIALTGVGQVIRALWLTFWAMGQVLAHMARRLWWLACGKEDWRG
jgi:hypothetical protein